jgi:hypothetical protein
MGYGDDLPLDLPGEMTDEDWAAIAGLGGGYNLDTPPPSNGGDAGLLPTSSTALDWYRDSDPSQWGLPNAPEPFDVAGNYYDDRSFEDLFPASPSMSLDTSISPVGSTGVGSDRKPSESGVQGYTKMDPATQRKSDDYFAKTFDPETGALKQEDPWWKKGLKAVFGPEQKQYDKYGREIPRSPSSSLAGLASGAASSAADSRAKEAALALQRDQTNASLYSTQQNAMLRSGEIEMMRKRLLNAQRSKALYTMNNPRATPEQKAAAQQTLATLDQQLTSPLVIGKPTPTAMPTRPWWETALALAGLTGQGANAVNYQLAQKSKGQD